MKQFALLALSLAIAGCKPDKTAEPTEPAEQNSHSKPRITAEDHAKLIHQKLKLEKDLGFLMDNHMSDQVPEIDAIKNRLGEASIYLRKLQSGHPALQPLNMELREWQFRAKNSRKSGDSASGQAAAAEILKLNQKLEELSKEQPEIMAAREQIDKTNEELHSIRRKIAAQIPEARPILDALDTLNRKLIEVVQ